jgi:hypothetical protein
LKACRFHERTSLSASRMPKIITDHNVKVIDRFDRNDFFVNVDFGLSVPDPENTDCLYAIPSSAVWSAWSGVTIFHCR